METKVLGVGISSLEELKVAQLNRVPVSIVEAVGLLGDGSGHCRVARLHGTGAKARNAS